MSRTTLLISSTISLFIAIVLLVLVGCGNPTLNDIPEPITESITSNETLTCPSPSPVPSSHETCTTRLVYKHSTLKRKITTCTY